MGVILLTTNAPATETNSTKEEVEEMIQELDKNGDRMISEEEWLSEEDPEDEDDIQDSKDEFRKFDNDSDGFLNEMELEELVREEDGITLKRRAMMTRESWKTVIQTMRR